VIQQKFFDAGLLQQSIELAESLDRFHFFLNAEHLEHAKSEIYKLAGTHHRSFIYKNMYWLESKRNSDEGQVYAARKLVDCDDCADNQYLLASALVKSGNEREALDVLHQIVDESTEASWLLFTVYKTIGNLYLRAKDFEAAEEYFNRAFAINSEDLNLLLSYGYLFLHLGQLDQAKLRFADITCRDKDFAEAYIGLALVHSSVGEFDLACANLAHVLDRQENNKMALFLHYNWSDKAENPDVTLDYIDNYLKTNPQDEQALTLKISWYIKKQNFRKAYDTLPVLKKSFTGNSRHIAQLENYLRDVV
jgi:tetratricopeptide (TPR) repeat protein